MACECVSETGSRSAPIGTPSSHRSPDRTKKLDRIRWRPGPMLIYTRERPNYPSKPDPLAGGQRDRVVP